MRAAVASGRDRRAMASTVSRSYSFTDCMRSRCGSGISPIATGVTPDRSTTQLTSTTSSAAHAGDRTLVGHIDGGADRPAAPECLHQVERHAGVALSVLGGSGGSLAACIASAASIVGASAKA